MSLKFMDGFEGYDDNSMLNIWDTWSEGTGQNGISDSLGRRGGGCYNVPGGVFAGTTFGNTYIGFVDETFIIGFAYYYVGGDNNTLLYLRDGSSNFISLEINDSNQLVFKLASFISLATIFTSDPIDINTWHYIEIKILSKASGGNYVGRLNEQELFNYTGDTICNEGLGYVSYYQFGCEAYTSCRFDDIYICNGEGTKNNDFLGDIRVDQIKPNGAGNYSQMTPSAGNNYECVDDDPYDDSDYVEGANIGEIDSYLYVDVPTDLDDTAIYGVQINSQAQRTAESDNIKIKGLIRTGSTDYKESTAQSLADEFKTRRSIWEDDPSDSNIWTQAKINTCEFGMEVN